MASRNLPSKLAALTCVLVALSRSFASSPELPADLFRSLGMATQPTAPFTGQLDDTAVDFLNGKLPPSVAEGFPGLVSLGQLYYYPAYMLRFVFGENSAGTANLRRSEISHRDEAALSWLLGGSCAAKPRGMQLCSNVVEPRPVFRFHLLFGDRPEMVPDIGESYSPDPAVRTELVLLHSSPDDHARFYGIWSGGGGTWNAGEETQRPALELQGLRQRVAHLELTDHDVRAAVVKNVADVILVATRPADWLITDIMSFRDSPWWEKDDPPPAPPVFDLPDAAQTDDDAIQLRVDRLLDRFQRDLRADRYDEAEKDAREALELDPNDPTAKQALEIVLKLRPPLKPTRKPVPLQPALPPVERSSVDGLDRIGIDLESLRK